MYQTDFNQNTRRRISDFLWKQWSDLGVSGHLPDDQTRFVDMEPFLLFSLDFARSDARLFDEILDWLRINGRFVNITRLKVIQKQFEWLHQNLIAAVAFYLVEEFRLDYWKPLCKINSSKEPENLFYLSDGSPIPVSLEKRDKAFLKMGWLRPQIKLRGLSTIINPLRTSAIQLKTRALLGVNARSDILCYLADGRKAYSNQIAKDLYYSRLTVQNTLHDLNVASVLQKLSEANKTLYSLNSDNPIFKKSEKHQWLNWVSFFNSLKKITDLHTEYSEDLNSRIFWVTLYELMHTESRTLNKLGFDFTTPDFLTPEEYIKKFQRNFSELLEWL
jgi:hypothetical protein